MYPWNIFKDENIFREILHKWNLCAKNQPTDKFLKYSLSCCLFRCIIKLVITFCPRNVPNRPGSNVKLQIQIPYEVRSKCYQRY